MSASLIVAQKIKTTAIEGEKIVEKIIRQQKEIKEFEESAKEILSKIPAAIGNASAQKVESVYMLKRIGCPQKITDKFEEDFENLQTQYKKVEGILNHIKESCHSKYSRINELKDLFQLVISKPNITEIETLRKNHNDLASQVHNGYLEIFNIEAKLTSMENAKTSKALRGMNIIVEDTNELYAQLLNSLITASTITSFIMAGENSNLDNSENTNLDNRAIGYILFM
jgi:hypothetical protein